LKIHLRSAQRGLILASNVVKKNYENLERAVREFPQVISKVNKFYEGLQELLAEKKIEQINHIQQTWGRVKYEYAAYAR
jgi:CRISPR/Cas system-associated protein Csm6